MKKFLSLIICIVILFTLSSCRKIEKNYYPDGKIQSSISYRFGKEHGKSIYYFQNPNTLEIEMEMKHGKRNGEFSRYFENGFLDTHCFYKNDSIEGIQEIYYPNGIKREENTYIHGKKEGAHKEYHIDGNIKVEGNYKNDLCDGTWTYYDERGVVVGEGQFDQGEGTLTAYDAMGRKTQTTHYDGNQKNGKEQYFNTAGKVYKEIVFKAGRIVSQHTDSTLIQ